MGSSSVGLATTRASGNSAARWNLSRATRRAVRRAAALAADLSMHSFRLHTDGSVTWNLWHPKPEVQPKMTSEGATRSGSSATSKSCLRSRARAQSHAARLAQETSRGRLRFALGRWKRAIAQPPPLQPPPPPPLPPPPPTDGCDTQLRQERMTERVDKRAPPSPAAGASPDPRAKRTLTLHPAGQPPPSLPPSPPSSNPPTPAKAVPSPAPPPSDAPPQPPPSTSTTSSSKPAASTVSSRASSADYASSDDEQTLGFDL